MEDGHDDGDIDYSRYTARELHEALAGIRRDEYPKNYAHILTALNALSEPVEVSSGEPPEGPLITVTQRTRDIIFWTGIVLLIVGTALMYWAFQRLGTLPNYLRMAVLVPLMTSYAMLRVDQYRNWDSVQGFDRVHAIGALLTPPLLLLASLVLLIIAPDDIG